MTQVQADQQLANITKKYFDFLNAQDGQELKPEKILSFFDNVRQVNSIYEPIKDLRQTRPDTIKQIIINLRGYFSYPNLIEPIYKTIVQLMSSVSFAVPPQEEKFRDTFSDYFFTCNYKDKDNAIDTLFNLLGDIKSLNTKFWWYLLCTYDVDGLDDPYLNKLRIFIDQFVKMPTELVSLKSKNTIIYIIYIFEKEQNVASKLEIVKNSLFVSIPITPKFVDNSKSLSSVSIFDSENKDISFQILHIIYDLGKEIFTNFLKTFVIYINQLDLKKVPLPANDQPVDSLINDTWIYELLRLRYILHMTLSIIQDKQEFSAIFQNIITDLKDEALKILIVFAVQLDSHDNVIIMANNNNPEYVKNVISFLGHLSVVFAPVFLKINEKEIVSFSESCKNKNKRLKIFTKEAKFMEEASKMCTDPLRLERYLCEKEKVKCLMPKNCLTLLLTLKYGPGWKFEEALEYINSIIESYSDRESELLNVFISRIAVIQSFLINQGLGIDHHFLANHFFDRCLTHVSVENLQTAFMIVESSSIIEDFTPEQRENWVKYLVKGFEDEDPSVNAATSKVFLHCLTHLTTESLCLIEMYLKINPDPNIDNLTTLTSIYSLCYNNESIENRADMMETILGHIKKFINDLPRDEVTLGLLTTLLFEEITSDKCEKVSQGLVEAFDLFLSNDELEKGNEPLEPLRMLSIFPNNYDLINTKYETFFPQLIDCIVKIINNPKTDSNLVQLLADTLVDTLILMDDSGAKFEEALKKINLINILHSREDFFENKKSGIEPNNSINFTKSDIEKSIILLTSIDQFLARINQPYKDLIDSKIPLPGSSKGSSSNISSVQGSPTNMPGMTNSMSDIDRSNFCAYIINSRYSIIKVLLDELNDNSDISNPSVSIYAKTMTGSYGYNVKLNKKAVQIEEKTFKSTKIENEIQFEQTQFDKSFSSFANQYSLLDWENIKAFENQISTSFDEDIAKDYGTESLNKFDNIKPFEKTITQPDLNQQQLLGPQDEGGVVLYPSCQATAFFESAVLESRVADQTTDKSKKSSFNLSQFLQPTSLSPPSSPNPNNNGDDSTKSPSAPDSPSSSTPEESNQNNNNINNNAGQNEEARLAQLRLLMEKKKKNLSNTNSSLVIKNHFPLLDIAANNIFNSPIRETIKIGFLYVKNGQSDQNSILQNRWDQVSPEFRSFIESIGTIVDLSTHMGFSGKLDNTGFSNGRYQLYFSTDRIEVMYHVAPLLPTDAKDVQQIYKKRHIGNDNVHVVWSEHAFDYDATTITSQFNDAHIIIYPINNVKDFFRVVIYKKSNDYHFGPLRGETIVGAKALPDLVRWTSVFSDRVSRMKTSTSYKLPNQLLSDSIRDVLQIKRNRVD